MNARTFWQQEAAAIRNVDTVIDKSVLESVENKKIPKNNGFELIKSFTEKINEVNQIINIYKHQVHKVYYFRSKLAVDYDGAPKAYHKDKDKGFDKLSNISESNLVKNADGSFYEQSSGDSKGYYVSKTSIFNRNMTDTNPNKWTDAMTLPYFVLPNFFVTQLGAKLGCWAHVINSNNNRHVDAFLCDTGPSDKIGEGSHALAQALGLPVFDNESDKNLNNGRGKSIGTDSLIIDFFVFPNISLGVGKVPNKEAVEEINPYKHYPDYLTFYSIIEDAISITKK
jgi:Fungal chitosanase of glycosyl hydrolase group 75